MKDPSRRNQELIEESSFLKQRIHELEHSESMLKWVEPVYSYPILFIIFFMILSFGWAKSACSGASSPPEIHIGSELEFPPYAFIDDSGQAAGFSVELIKAVADVMGLSVKISTGSWDIVWKDLVAGRLDALPIVAKLPGRQRLVDFSIPHTETFDAFFVRNGDPSIKNIAAAQGMEIVVMRSDAAHHALLEHNFRGELIIVDTIPEGLKLISSGKHNAFLGSKLIGILSIKKYGITGLTAGQPIPDYKRVFSFAVKKGDTELMEKLNQGLLIVKTNGEYDRIYDKWFSVHDPWYRIQKYILPATITVITIVLIAVFWLVMLRRLVNKRTNELAEKNDLLHHAQEELIKSHQQLRDVHRLANIGVWDWVANTDTVTWSEELYRIAGIDTMSPAPTYAEHPNIYAPESWDRLKEAVEKALQTGTPFQLELELIRPDGTTRMVNAFGGAMYDNQGRVTGLQGTVQDITARTQAEEALRQEQQFSKIVLDNLPGIFYLYTYPENRLILWNKQHETLLGYTTEETKDKFVTDWHLPENKEAVLSAVEEVMKNGQSSIDGVLIAKDGHLIPFSFSGVRFEARGRLYFMGIGIDISERMRAEAALRESEKRYREIYDSSNDALFIQDIASGSILDVNERMLEIYGYANKQEALKRTIEDLSALEEGYDEEKIKEMNQKAIDSNSNAFEWRAKKKDGEKFWVQVTLQRTQIDGENRFLTSVHDITERKRVEEAIRDSEEKFSRAFEKAPLLMTISSIEDGTYLDVNEKFIEVSGFKKEKAIGKTSVELGWLKEKDRDLLIHDLKKKGFVEGVELELEAKNKRKIICLYYGEVINIGGQQRLLSIAQDITDRKLAEESLRKSEERFREMAELMPEIIFETDIQGILTFVNRNAFALFGYTQEDFAGGLNAIDMITTDDRDRAMKNMLRIMNGDKIGSNELTMRRKDGSIFPSMIHSSAIIHEGKPVGLRGFIVDMTDRKRAEEENRSLEERLQRAEKMEALGQLAGWRRP